MKFSIWFSGPAGSWINTCGVVLGKILSEYGYFIYGDKEYSSLIKGGNNLFVLYISDATHYISKTIDYYIYFDNLAIETNQAVYSINKKHFVDKKAVKHQNAFAIGHATRILGLTPEELLGSLLKRLPLPSWESNKASFWTGYESTQEALEYLKPQGAVRKLTFGNELIAQGAMAAGLNFYSAYPMTPASSIIDIVAQNRDVVYFQWEDEISVAMSMLGAKFAWNRAMCATSGGGFALMSESISFSNQAEIGGLYVLSQRAGPSTWTPTFTSQWDLNYALHASFWDTMPIVVAPYTFENSYNLIGKALNWSDIYQHPVIYLVDKWFSESYISVNPSELEVETMNRWKLVIEPEVDFWRYSDSKDGISPYTIPGTANGEFIASSYEHDEFGKETEEWAIRMKMESKRFQKLITFAEHEYNNNFSGFDISNPSASKFFVTFGVNYYWIRWHIESLSDPTDWWIILIKIIQPLDLRLGEFLEKNSQHITKIVFVEQNFSWQIENWLTHKLALDKSKWGMKITNIRSTNLYPIFEENIWEKA